MLDYLSLQGSTENPTFWTILMTVLLAFLLSSLVAFTYKQTTRKVLTPVDFLQTLVLLSVVAATVMQAIGDSLAHGLGMIGALAIIRFRTTLRSPRNMAFTFASLAAGIACGVYGFVIAITGTIGFCLIAFILRYSPLSLQANLVGYLTFSLPIESEDLVRIEAALDQYCDNYAQISYKIIQSKLKKEEAVFTPKMMAFEYRLSHKKQSDIILLDKEISSLESIQSLKIEFKHASELV